MDAESELSEQLQAEYTRLKGLDQQVKELNAEITRLETINSASIAEIVRLKADIEATLTKAARNENILLQGLDKATSELVRLKEEKACGDPSLDELIAGPPGEAYREIIRKQKLVIQRLVTWIEEDYNLDEWQDGSPGKELIREAKELCQ